MIGYLILSFYLRNYKKKETGMEKIGLRPDINSNNRPYEDDQDDEYTNWIILINLICVL